MVIERHNNASRLINTLSKGEYGGNIILTGIGSEAQMAQQSLVMPAHVANRILLHPTQPSWLLPNLSANELRSCSEPGAIYALPAGKQDGHGSNIQALHPSC